VNSRLSEKHRAPDLVDRVVEAQGGHLAPGGHQRTDRPVAHAEHPVDDLLFDLLDLAALATLLNDGLDLFFRDPGFGGLPAREEPEHEIGRMGEQPDERRGDCPGELHRNRHDLGDRFRIGQPDALGDQFTQHEREEGHDHQHDDEAERVGIGLEGRYAGDHGRHVVGDGLAAVDTGEQADQRDADLYGREQLAGGLLEADGRLGAPVALLGGKGEPVLPRRDQGDLGHREYPVEQDQGQQDQ